MKSRTELKKNLQSAKAFVLSLLVIILLGGGFYYVSSIRESQAEDARILTRLKTIILLPDGVTPTMAVVTDAEVLKNQQPIFFADVKNGNRLIIYPELAIIYDYEANKIIKIGPVQNAQLK